MNSSHGAGGVAAALRHARGDSDDDDDGDSAEDSDGDRDSDASEDSASEPDVELQLLSDAALPLRSTTRNDESATTGRRIAHCLSSTT